MGIQNLKTSATNNNNINMKAFIAFSALLAVAAAIPAGPPAYHAPAPAYERAQYTKILHQYMAMNTLLLMTTAKLTSAKTKSVMVTLHLVNTVFSFPTVVPKLLPTEPLMLTLATLLK